MVKNTFQFIFSYPEVVFKVDMSFHGNKKRKYSSNFTVEKHSIDIPNGTKWNVSEKF